MKTPPSITKERFFQLLEAYGGHPKRWPAEERQAALQFLEKSEEAKEIYQHACQLDQVLDRVPFPPRMLKNSILASVSPPLRPQERSFYTAHFLRPVIISLVFFLLGMSLGFMLISSSPWDEEDVYLLAFNEDIL